jgi:hypothetical protein
VLHEGNTAKLRQMSGLLELHLPCVAVRDMAGVLGALTQLTSLTLDGRWETFTCNMRLRWCIIAQGPRSNTSCGGVLVCTACVRACVRACVSSFLFDLFGCIAASIMHQLNTRHRSAMDLGDCQVGSDAYV